MFCGSGATYISDKLIGGPRNPRVFFARRELFADRVPDVPGGGTVADVNPTQDDDVADVELREEAGASAIGEWNAHPNLEILGNLHAERLSIVSFVVRHGDRHFHHNFVVAVSNDLFGIQSRGGWCAGPYGHRLHDISDAGRRMSYPAHRQQAPIGSLPSAWPRRAGSSERPAPSYGALCPAGHDTRLRASAVVPVPQRGRPLLTPTW